jgi:hypothetical protein
MPTSVPMITAHALRLFARVTRGAASMELFEATAKLNGASRVPALSEQQIAEARMRFLAAIGHEPITAQRSGQSAA